MLALVRMELVWSEYLSAEKGGPYVNFLTREETTPR